jgi:plastocyanin
LPFLVVLSLAIASAVALGSVRPSADRRVDERVFVRDNFFDHRSVTVAKGDTVKWIWRGDNRHNVTFVKVPPKAKKRSSPTRVQGSWKRTFRKVGRYKYVCTLFAGMQGQINVVRPAGASISAAR